MDFGPLALWNAMTPIAKAVVVALILLSLWSIYAAGERLLAFRKARRHSLAFAREAAPLLAKGDADAALEVARRHGWGHVARVTRAGLVEFSHGRATSPLTDKEQVEAGRRAIEREALVAHSDLRRNIGSLATIATTAPFIGLFGTVIGIINAFRGMALTGSGGIGAVSAGIAEALVTTALGLFVAIPAAWMFNHFTNALDRFGVEMTNASSELVDFFIKSNARRAGPDRHVA